MYKPYHNLGWSNFIPCIDGKVIGVLLIEKWSRPFWYTLTKGPNPSPETGALDIKTQMLFS
jgi:hypothetical protein